MITANTVVNLIVNVNTNNNNNVNNNNNNNDNNDNNNNNMNMNMNNRRRRMLDSNSNTTETEDLAENNYFKNVVDDDPFSDLVLHDLVSKVRTFEQAEFLSYQNMVNFLENKDKSCP